MSNSNNNNNNNNHKPICIIGSINIDTYLSLDRLPSIGETLNTIKQTTPTYLGGKSCNQAIAAYRTSLYNNIIYIAHCGNDVLGKLAIDYLQQYTHRQDNNTNNIKLDISNVIQHNNQSTGQAYILHCNDGNNSIILVNGSNYTSWSNDYNILHNRYSHIISQSCCILLSGEIPVDINIYLATIAKQYNIYVIYDVGGSNGCVNKQLLTLIDTIIPNETELIQLIDSDNDNNNINIDINNDQQIIDICQQIQQQYKQLNILVTLGSHGSIHVNAIDHTVTRVNSRNNINVIDTTGSGDCYRGVYVLYHYGEKQSIQQSMQYASNAAELSIQYIGAAQSMPYRSDIEEQNS